MPSKTLEKRYGMLDEVAATSTGKQFKAYANIYNSVPEIGCCPPWELCTVSKNLKKDGLFTAIDDHKMEIELPVHYIASDLMIAFKLAPKTRVIASRKHMFLPCFYDELERAAPFIYKNFDESEFFAGVISDEYRHGDNGLEYLVLFDDGHAQYVEINDIRVVNGSPGIEHVPENTRNFYDYYFGVKWPLRRKADCKTNDILRVLLNGKFHDAKVCKFFGSSLILIHFLEENIFEWIFEGSDRIEVVHKSVCKFLKDKGMNHNQSNGSKVQMKVSLEEELFYSEAYKAKLNRSIGQQSGIGGIGVNAHKLDHSASTNRPVGAAAARITHNAAKMAIEFLIILAQIRHEMNQSGQGKHRIDLFADKSLDAREPFWERICRFFHVNVNQQNRTGLKMLIEHFRDIDDEFRNAYEHYLRPHFAVPKTKAKHLKTVEKNAIIIQQEVTSKVQRMQKYLEIRANGDQNHLPSVNMVQYLDDVIDEFSKLTEKY